MTTPTLVLWGAGTMRTHRTLWLAEELGLDYEQGPAQRAAATEPSAGRT